MAAGWTNPELVQSTRREFGEAKRRGVRNLFLDPGFVEHEATMPESSTIWPHHLTPQAPLIRILLCLGSEKPDEGVVPPGVHRCQGQPMARGVEEHGDDGHAQFRSWCPFCVAPASPEEGEGVYEFRFQYKLKFNSYICVCFVQDRFFVNKRSDLT